MKTNTNTQYLEKLISEGEHVHQDFKFAISDARKIAKSLSAFANTEGGRLLDGVKDNGKIAGVRSEEELYMIEAAANLYCRPEVELDTRIYHVDGKDVLEVQVNESQQKPIYALDEENRPWAYVRIKDENILANPIHLNIWKHDRAEKDVVMTYTQREQQVLTILQQHAPLTLGQCSRLTHMSRKQISRLLADFIRFGLVEQRFVEHTFYFQLKDSE